MNCKRMADQSRFKPKTIAVEPAQADSESENRKPSAALAHYKDFDHVRNPKKAVVVASYIADDDIDEVQKGQTQITPSKHQTEDVPEQTPNTKINNQVHGCALLPNLPLDDADLNSNLIIGSYRITKTLGQGTFGKVKEGIHLFTKQKVSQTTLKVCRWP